MTHHDSHHTDETDSAAALLERNYQYLSDLYKRGRFEDEIDEKRFTFSFGGARNQGAAGAPAAKGKPERAPAPMKLAADDLYELARHVESAEPRAARDAAILILRVKVLSYEIDDYFLDVPQAKAKFFVEKARAIGEVLRGFDGSERPDGADPLVAYAARHYPFVEGLKRRRELIQQLVLVTLSGVNQMYRKNHDDSYHEALGLATRVRRYIQFGLPKLASPERVSLGLLGLNLYMLGRLKLSLNMYEADRDFIESAECYANRVHDKEAQYRQGKITLAEYESTRLLTLRRSALVSAFGSGFLSLLTSDLPAALKSIALARGIVKQNSGLVNSAYTDLLYCAVKRAQRSSDASVLREVRRTLRRCFSVFRRYVPNRHYEHRAGLELALTYHFLARVQPQRARVSYTLAERYLSRAVEFAGQRTEREGGGPDEPAHADDAERPRNSRLLAESLTYLSHIVRHCSPGSMENVMRAIELANRAVMSAKNSQLYAAEARIALASAQASKAELLKPGEPAFKKALSDARVNFHFALVFNRGANARISAICFIRLGQICLLDKETFAEARHWHDKWVDIKSQVHHEFCHQMGRELEQAVERLGGITYLLIDPDRTLKHEFWLEELDKFLINQTIYHVAKDISNLSAGGEGADDTSKSARSQDDFKKRLVDFLKDEVGLSRSTAYKWVDDHDLERRLKEHLRH